MSPRTCSSLPRLGLGVRPRKIGALRRAVCIASQSWVGGSKCAAYLLDVDRGSLRAARRGGMLPGGSSKEARDADSNAPPAGYPVEARSAGDDRHLGCTGRARGPLSAADASALGTSTLAEDPLGSGTRVGCDHGHPCLPGRPSFRDHFVAALSRQARLARGGRTAASPGPGAQGIRVGAAVHEPRAALRVRACCWQRQRGADRCCASRPL
jgi:hypothetical protein